MYRIKTKGFRPVPSYTSLVATPSYFVQAVQTRRLRLIRGTRTCNTLSSSSRRTSSKHGHFVGNPHNLDSFTASGPGPRSWPGLAHDSKRKRSIYSDMRAWDGNVWTRIAPEGPPARTQFARGYDSLRDRFALFGGLNNKPQRVLNDLWEFEGPTGRKSNPDPSDCWRHGSGVRLGWLLRETNNRRFARRIGTERPRGHPADCSNLR
jgi:hypothetical protein